MAPGTPAIYAAGDTEHTPMTHIHFLDRNTLAFAIDPAAPAGLRSPHHAS